MNLDDTIVAVATPPGRGGIGVIRLSGPKAKAIAYPMLRLKHDLEPGRAVFAELIEPGTVPAEASAERQEGRRIDEVVVTYFEKPHSYTTDDVVEISAHGSPVILRHMVEMAIAGGARLAEPGEFTMRAFLNGRLDLTQAEAVRDLIESQTLHQAKVAAQQLDGAISRRLKPIKQNLVGLLATLEAGIDFADDDISVLPDNEIVLRIAPIRDALESLAESFAFGKLIHEGLTLAIVGLPNVGKSSLFNRLVESERAIVTATPGTTRDLISETVTMAGIPVRLVDTAGLRSAQDEAERIGIRKSKEALADADLVLVVTDSSRPRLAAEDELLAESTAQRVIVVENKSDLRPAETMGIAKGIRTSALTGEGVAELRQEILRRSNAGPALESESGFLTSARHQGLVLQSIAALDAATTAVERRVPHEMLLLDLYSALRPLDEITGATTNDDILNLIFSSFCIGK